MKGQLSARIGALIATIGIVAAAAVGASPAVAAPTAQLTVQPAVYHPGSWGSGITVSGSGFAASSTITLDVTYNHTQSLGTATTTTDAAGAFSNFTFTPTTAPFAAGVNDNHYVTATDGAGASASAALDVRWAPSITANVLSLPTSSLVDPGSGFAFSLTGLDDNEVVTAAATYNGTAVSGLTDLRAGVRGILTTDYYYLAGGVATAGTITFTFTGATSGVVLTTSVTVTGPDIAAAGGGVTPRFAAGSGTAPAPAPAPGTTGTLPVVAG
ncbi:hypothetical protein KNO15_06665 [Leifsonia shinshuensis]|uniref:hypothetical protein n=1 Tax=Leifsonia shinshuensis TaxID=150026 RepID=UPI001F50DD3E|nr:hypothetical protein [Leifsonia shinshuensis]MCI0156376.1 hypothetical protein [Leifsonia shinshuensis]